MTAPGGVPNLPMGALTVDTLAEKLQDMTAASMRGRVVERMPGIFNSSMGGNPASEFSFFGIMTQLWAGFNEAVANADPADIQGPDDLPGLMVNFVEGLPLIGDFVALVESIVDGSFEVGDVLAAIKNAFDTLGSMLGFSGPGFDLSAAVTKFVDFFPIFGGDIEGPGLLNGVLDGIDLEPGAVMRMLRDMISEALEDRPLFGEVVEPITGRMQRGEGLAAHFRNARELWGDGLDLNLAPGDFDPGEVLRGFMRDRLLPTDQFNNLLSLWGDALPNLNLDPGVFDPPAIVEQFIENRLKPTGKLAELVDGLLPGERVPILDASKIGSGEFIEALIPNLDASKIGTGIFGSGRIPTLDASKIGSGTFGTGLIPNLDASKITTGVISEAVTTIGDLRDNLVNGLLGGGSGFGFNNNDANQQATEIAQTALAAAAAAAAAQEQLAAQEQGQTSGGGTNFRTSFGGADGASLSSTDWNPASGNILIRGSGGRMGIKAGLGDGVYNTTCKHVCLTNDQRLSVVLGDQGGSVNAPLRALWHLASNSSVNGGACLVITKETVKFGYLSAADVFTQIGPTHTATFGQGTRIDAYNVGDDFIVEVNGVPRITGVDSGGLITLSNTFGAVRMERATTNGWFGSTTYDCFRLSSFGLSDYSAVTEIAVDAWKISRSSTTEVALSVSNGSTVLLPSSFFSTTDYVDGATVTTQGTGVITVATAGLYELSCSITAKLSLESGNTYTAFPWAVAVNGAQATGAIPAGVPEVIYLNANDTVQPMVSAVGPSMPTGWAVNDTNLNHHFGVSLSCTHISGFAHFSGRQIGTA